MSYNLFIDDERAPKSVTWINLPLVDWVVVKNYRQFVEVIQSKGLPKRISFDHDLAFEHYPFGEKNPHPTQIPYDTYKEKTGYHCALWLVEYCIDKNLPLPEYFVHTMNPVGGDNIRSLLQKFQQFQLDQNVKAK